MKRNGKNTNKVKPTKLTKIIIKDTFTGEIVIIFKPCKQNEIKARNFSAMGCEVIRVYE